MLFVGVEEWRAMSPIGTEVSYKSPPEIFPLINFLLTRG